MDINVQGPAVHRWSGCLAFARLEGDMQCQAGRLSVRSSIKITLGRDKKSLLHSGMHAGLSVQTRQQCVSFAYACI